MPSVRRRRGAARDGRRARAPPPQINLLPTSVASTRAGNGPSNRRFSSLARARSTPPRAASAS
eukprot:18777-Pelagococcus_subviridis.AAC.1